MLKSQSVFFTVLFYKIAILQIRIKVIHTVSDLLSLIFKMNEQLDLNFNAEKDQNGNVIPDTLSLSFGNPLINEKLAAYITFLNQLPEKKREYFEKLIKES